MAEKAADHRPAPGAPAMSADDIAARSFPTAFRGFDPVAVRAFLGDLADELRSAAEREARLRAEIEELSRAVAAGPPAPVPAGTDATEVVDAARRKAAEIEAEAAARMERVLVGAREKADRMLADAEAEAGALVDAGRLQADRVREEAEQDARRIKAEGERAGAAARVDADRRANELRRKAEEEAAEIVEAARERGRQMVSEAQAARERMLADLSRRKRSAQAQLEQLRTGRDRLLETLKSARRGLDEVTLRFEAADMMQAARASEARARPEAPSAADGGERPGPAETAEAAAGERAPRPHVIVDSSSPPSAPPAPAGPAPAQRKADEDLSPPAGNAPPAKGEEETERNGGDRSERRSSALRILRRNRQPEPREEERPAPRVEAVPEPPHPSEGVRIIGPTRAADQEPSEEGEPPTAAPTVAPDVNGAESPGPELHRADDAVVEEPEREDERGEETTDGAPEEAAPPDQDAATAEPAGVERAAEPEAPEPEVPEPEGAGAHPVEDERAAPSVEELFAKIRKDREEAVHRAREVLEGDRAAEGPEPDGSGAAEGPSEETESVTPAAASEGVGDKRSDAEEALLQRRDRVLDELEPALVRRLKRALQDEQNAALDRLRTHRGPVTAAAVLPGERDGHGAYREVAIQYLEQAARAGAADAPLGPAPVSVDDLAAELAGELARNLRSRLERALEQGAGEGTDLPAVAEHVSAVFRESKTHRAAPLGGHYLIAAYARGAFLATPEGERLRWVVDDETACPDCDDNALAGPTPRGQVFPTGQLLPPAHVGCRCLLVPAPH